MMSGKTHRFVDILPVVLLLQRGKDGDVACVRLRQDALEVVQPLRQQPPFDQPLKLEVYLSTNQT